VIPSLCLGGFRAPSQVNRFRLAGRHTDPASKAHFRINGCEFINSDGVHRTSLQADFAGITCFLVNPGYKGGRDKDLVSALLPVKDGAAVVAAVADTVLDVEGMNEAVLIAFT
jgi:hypothetical protein